MCKTGDNLLKLGALAGGGYFLGPEIAAAFGGAEAAPIAGEALAAGGGADATAAAWGSGAGLGGDTLSAMGYGGGTAAGTAGASAAAPSYVSGLSAGPADAAFTASPSSLSGMTTSQLGEISAGATAADLAASAAGGAGGASLVGGGGGPAGGGAGGAGVGSPAVTPQAGLPAPSAPVGGGGASPLGIDANPLDARLEAGTATTPTGVPGAAPGATPAVTPGATTPPAASPGTAQPSMVQKAVDLISNNKLNTANLGLAGLSMVRQKQMGDAYGNQLKNIAGPTSAIEQQLLSKFSAGEISGSDQFAIAQFAQKQKAAVNQYYAKLGTPNSSAHLSALREIDTQAEGMRQQALQNMLSGGLKAAGVTNPILTAGVNAGLTSDAAAMKAMQDYLAMMSRMNTPAPTQAGTPGG